MGNTLHTLSSRSLKEPIPGLSVERFSELAAKVRRNKPNRLADSSVSLAEKAQIFYMTDVSLDHDYKQRLGDLDRKVICREDSILNKVKTLQDSERLLRNCFDTVIDSQTRVLELQNHGIQSIAQGWYQLQQIPIGCINLSYNDLTDPSPEVHNNLAAGVKIVDLSYNLIRQIKNDTFSNFYLMEVGGWKFLLSNLWALNLAENKRSNISFSVCLPVSLNKLHLKKNQILSIPDGVFSRLQNLSHLDLDQNHITKLQSNVFKGLTSLVALDLGQNQISKIEAGAFLALKNVITINLNGNSISICESDAFDGLEKLTSLHLSLNKFTSITKNNFDKLPASLLFLDLDNNEITHNDTDVFIGVPRNTLKLNNNKLSKILPDQFKIKDLEKLYLKNNSITEINQDSFLGLSAVKYLLLDNNQISETPRVTLRNLNALSRFDISRNPITKLKNGTLET